ncbi:hypothetical protein ABZ746_10875 [Streptomyces sp. NPDC020096]
MPEYEIKTGDRDAFIAGLRELADFLTANPGVLVPKHPRFTVIVDATDPAVREAVAERVAAPLGAPLEDLGRGFYSAWRHFGPIAYSVTAVPPKDEQ